MTTDYLTKNKKNRNWGTFQLPHYFKKIGVMIAIISFLGLLLNKFTFDLEEYRLLARYGLLIGFLMISISREKIEDELISKLRTQSYTVAFIAGVLYALVVPVLDYSIDFYFGAEELLLKNMGDFMILWLLLSIQVFYFELLKRRF